MFDNFVEVTLEDNIPQVRIESYNLLFFFSSDHFALVAFSWVDSFHVFSAFLVWLICLFVFRQKNYSFGSMQKETYFT